MATSAAQEVQNGQPSFRNFFKALSTAYKKLIGSYENQIRCGRTAMEMPCLPIVPLQEPVLGCCTGPLGGMCQLNPDSDTPPPNDDTPTAGIRHWYRPQPHADGDSITLYEHKPSSPQHHGDPIADVYAVISRPNNSTLVVADGVNWGIKPRLAARCAVHGCIEHLNEKLFYGSKLPSTTQDIFHVILRSFHSAQRKIIEHGGTTTTLCVAVTVELVEPKGNNKWGLCIVTVGDTLCYVWRNEAMEVYEITAPVHMGKDRNPRDCGGCLGADLGDHPDLSNLGCCFVPVADGDVVFVVSDGISDNFDPILLKEAIMEKPPQVPPSKTIHLPQGFPQADTPPTSPEPLPNGEACMPVLTINAEQRHDMSLAKMTQLLRERWSVKKRLMASDLTDSLISYVIEATDGKRKFLEQYHTEMEGKQVSVAERRVKDREVTQRIKSFSGKLDHATVAACKVGRVYAANGGIRPRTPTNSYVMNTAMVNRQMSAPQGVGDYSTEGGTVFYQSRPRPGVNPSSPSRTRDYHPRATARFISQPGDKSLVV